MESETEKTAPVIALALDYPLPYGEDADPAPEYGRLYIGRCAPGETQITMRMQVLHKSTLYRAYTLLRARYSVAYAFFNGRPDSVNGTGEE